MQPYGGRSVRMRTSMASDYQVLLGEWSYADDAQVDAHRDGITHLTRQLWDISPSSRSVERVRLMSHFQRQEPWMRAEP
jgi:hypothetical protein